ncbi:MAG: Si-specific NAD(P)(+) transhydrogenase [Planctomycetota bacterium]|nr:Si-specific NAD(P)(+) transhydrogenase [Planctomycetota bacterium]
MNDRYDLLCLGCGPAGEKASTQASYYGKRVAIIEKNTRPGGAMVNTGTLPSKALRETALLCSALKRTPLPGSEYTIDHGLSVPRFMARRLLLEEQEHDRIEASFDRHGIEVHHGSGRLLDAHTVQVTDDQGETKILEADNILIATGSSPLRPDHIPFDHPSVVDADGVLNLATLPHSMIIVGAGVIGCEYASIFAEIDVKVTVINPSHEILGFLDGECRDHLTLMMQEAGVEFKLGQSVKSVTGKPGGGVKVEFEKGAPLEADILLWAAGRQSNTSDLGLEEVGIEMGKRGLILVDEQYRTNVESIFAAGDVIGFPALASTSMEQGRVAACAMFDIPFKTSVAAHPPLGLYTIPPVSCAGITEQAARESGRSVIAGRAQYHFHARGRMLGDGQGIVKCVFDRETHQLLGTTIVGLDATELIHLAQNVIETGGGIETFINTCFNYPSLSELYKYAAYNALQALDHIERESSDHVKIAKAA